MGSRIEHAGALIAHMMANRYRKEGAASFKIYDFAPHMDEPELSIDDLKDWE